MSFQGKSKQGCCLCHLFVCWQKGKQKLWHWQVSKLVSLKTFCDDPANNKKGIKFKSQSERKRFVKETLGLKVVVDPRTNEPAVPVHDHSLMLVGHRKSAKRTREETAEDKGAAKESFTKAKAGLDVKVNTKDRCSDSGSSASSKSSGNSSKSSFGMRSDSEEGKKKGKRKAAGKLSSAKKKAKGQQEKLPAPGSLPTAKRKQGKQKDTGANTVCLARKQLELLQELTASVVWKSVIRASELDRRLAKGQSTVDELEGLQSNPRADEETKKLAEEMQTKIFTLCQEAASVKEISRVIRQSSPADLAEDVRCGGNLRENFLRCSPGILVDHQTLTEMLQAIAKKLAEAVWLMRQVPLAFKLVWVQCWFVV
ncbi:unnamed protein product [Effrenium voratum]|uniref:Uncharacterized protein n=1 Tax=Effrenium voratum TaxID=2562239 RepID=A0AA36JBC1_9DINO|nr:unnamed protein product [Effrenium voratum]CAJ1402135.1 unnamed protein product [Effrenium voratum]CAJ1420379.1 unnamed protein product [Effrenium voratum]